LKCVAIPKKQTEDSGETFIFIHACLLPIGIRISSESLEEKREGGREREILLSARRFCASSQSFSGSLRERRERREREEESDQQNI
jgi:hypothetical protein